MIGDAADWRASHDLPGSRHLSAQRSVESAMTYLPWTSLLMGSLVIGVGMSALVFGRTDNIALAIMSVAAIVSGGLMVAAAAIGCRP